MAKQQLVVVSELGTFTRTTARPYTHLVVAQGRHQAAAPGWTDAQWVLGWCGRLDLARALATSTQASHYRHVAIVDVVTGEVVR